MKCRARIGIGLSLRPVRERERVGTCLTGAHCTPSLDPRHTTLRRLLMGIYNVGSLIARTYSNILLYLHPHTEHLKS